MQTPIDEPTSLKRLGAIRDQTRDLKASAEPYVSSQLLKIFGVLPAALTRPVFNQLGYKVTTSLSNIPGPTTSLQMASAPVYSFTYFVPPQGTIAHLFSILSYRGKVMIGLASDERVVSDTNQVLKWIPHQVRELETELGLTISANNNCINTSACSKPPLDGA